MAAELLSESELFFLFALCVTFAFLWNKSPCRSRECNHPAYRLLLLRLLSLPFGFPQALIPLRWYFFESQEHVPCRFWSDPLSARFLFHSDRPPISNPPLPLFRRFLQSPVPAPALDPPHIRVAKAPSLLLFPKSRSQVIPSSRTGSP